MNEDAFRSLQSTRTATVSTQETDSPLTFGGMVSMAPYTVLLDIDSTMDYAVVPPLAYEGRQVFRQLLTGVGRGAFAVTSACEDIPAVLRWADYLYTEAGGRLAYAGLEGEDYTISETGTWTWNEDEESFGMIESAGRGVVSVGTSTPGLEPAAFMRNSSIQVDTYVRRQIDTIRDTLVLPFPVTWPADEATEARIDELQRALATCVDTAIANFAMGKVELTDETWQAFEAELYALGVEEFVGLWQAVYDAQADAP